MCRNVGADMFGVQFGRECMCGDSRDIDLLAHVESVCNYPCTGDASISCGGRKLPMDVNVYIYTYIFARVFVWIKSSAAVSYMYIYIIYFVSIMCEIHRDGFAERGKCSMYCCSVANYIFLWFQCNNLLLLPAVMVLSPLLAGSPSCMKFESIVAWCCRRIQII